jgi:hypothetical protein
MPMIRREVPCIFADHWYPLHGERSQEFLFAIRPDLQLAGGLNGPGCNL